MPPEVRWLGGKHLVTRVLQAVGSSRSTGGAGGADVVVTDADGGATASGADALGAGEATGSADEGVGAADADGGGVSSLRGATLGVAG